MRGHWFGLAALLALSIASGCSIPLSSETGPGGSTQGEDPPPDPGADPPSRAGSLSTFQTPSPANTAGPTGDAMCDQGSLPATADLFLTLPTSRMASSAAQARGVILNQQRPPDPETIRPLDFLAFYPTSYPKPLAGALNVVPSLAKVATDGELVLQVGVQAPDAAGPRRPTSLTFVVDTSPSMSDDSLARAKAAVTSLARALVEGDAINLITTGASREPLALIVGADTAGDVEQAITGLQREAGADLGAAVDAAYGLADASFQDGGINRVVLITDGGVPSGAVDLVRIAERASTSDRRISLVGVGVGPELVYSDRFLREAANAGRGALVYLEDAQEADARLFDRFDDLMDTAASDVRLTLSLPWYLAVEDVDGAGFAGSAADLGATELPPGRALIFRQVLRACSPTVAAPTDTIGVTVTWTAPDGLSRSFTAEPTLADLAAAAAPQGAKVTAILAYAEALRTFDRTSLLGARALADAALTAAGGADDELEEILTLIDADPLSKPISPP